MKKLIILLMMILGLLAVPSVLSATDDMAQANITLNFPTNRTYTNETGTADLTLLNATVRWNVNTNNITNVTFIFTSGSTEFRFTNSTRNGTNTAAGLGDFSYRIQPDDLTANLAYNVRVEVRNSTDATLAGDTINSSFVVYTLDSLNPSITIQQPAQGEKVSAKGTGKVIIDYTPTDTNLGNSTYYLNGVRQTSSISASTTSNLTSGSRKNTFTKFFGANNDSITLIVEITDLAGRKSNSSTTTFSVFREGAAEPVKVFVTPSGEIISTPAQPKGKAITKPLTLGNIGNAGNLLSNPFVWGGVIVAAVGLFIWWQNRKK